MADTPDEGGPGEGQGKKRRGGVPAVFTFLLIVMGLILLAEVFANGLKDQTEVSYNRFLFMLYSGQVKETLLEGDQKLTGVFRASDEDKPFFTYLPKEAFAALDQDIRSLVDIAPVMKDEAELLRQLGYDERDDTAGASGPAHEPEIVPTRAWIVPEIESNGHLVFVSYYRNAPGRLTHARIEPSSPPWVNIFRLKKALARSGVELRDVPLSLSEKGVDSKPENKFLLSLVLNLIPWLLIIGVLWFVIFRQMRSPGGAGGVLSFGRARPALISKERTGVTFDDVAGIEEAKQEVSEIVEFLKDPTRFSRVGARIPRGVMLVGPPGAGKTLLAKAIAGEASVPFFSISGSDFVEMFVGVGASRVRDLFRQAREKSPCLIFLDEIDAVGRRRGSGLGGGHDEREQTLNAILVEMDGFETDEGIILLAATNRPDVLDPALLRPGRFDRQIVIDLPDVEGREAILSVHGRNVRMHPSVDLALVARGTPGFSGAELASLVNEAALRATLAERDYVLTEDLEEARDRVRFGREKASRTMDEIDRRVTAYHEAGHAVVGAMCEGVEPLHKVTIIPRGMALGATMVLPKKDRYHQRRNQLLGIISFAYGGRLAEETFFGDVTSGAYDDIHKATEIARAMVTQFGMSERLGAVNYAEKDDAVFLGNEIVKKRNYSDDTARVIDAEVKRILDECYEVAKSIIHDNREKVERVAEALLKYETLHAGEVEAILGGASAEEARRQLDQRRVVSEPAPPRAPRAEPAPRTYPGREEGLPPAGEPAVS